MKYVYQINWGFFFSVRKTFDKKMEAGNFNDISII